VAVRVAKVVRATKVASTAASRIGKHVF
jgi:hypothetical protein